MSLEEQSAARKARLLALRNKGKTSEQTSQTSQHTTETATQAQDPVIKSRNYDPETRTNVKGFSRPPTTLDENSETVEAVSQAIQDEVLSKFRDMANVGDVKAVFKQKKITWDLERDISDDLKLLDERTDDVIHEVVRHRIQTLRQEKQE